MNEKKYYDKLVQMNNRNKQNILEALEYIKEYDKMKYKEEKKWVFEKETDGLYLCNKIKARRKKINHVGMIYSLLNINTDYFISNISELKKHMYILDKYLLSEVDWNRFIYSIITDKVYESVKIIRVSNLEQYVSKNVLLGHAVVSCNNEFYCILVTKSNELLLVSDLNLVVDRHTKFKFNNILNVKSIQISNIEIADTRFNNITELRALFQGSTNINNIVFENFNTKYIKDFSYMFHGCKKLQHVTVELFNTESATKMVCMFEKCESLENLDLQNWNTSNVKTFKKMFSNCNSLKKLDLEKWNIDNVEDCTNMFYCCIALKDLSISTWNLDRNKVITDGMFVNCVVRGKL